MLSLLETLGYKQVNTQITFECNDISHLSGTHTVASRSVIENGKTANSRYKKFRVKDLPEGKIDDFSSMREIMARRLKEIEKTGYIPDLIIIDGGKGQLGAVMKVIEDYIIHPPAGTSFTTKGRKLIELLQQLQIVSIAKREEELFLPAPPAHSSLSPQLRGTDGEKVVEKEQSPFVKKILEKDS
ncbi:MAG: hypothetical protein H6767_02430 [Candidatus Peribacteria bacterium]|nr:MAG: hypothetical protein H6767_02430 [Candidatus Peribacteria bacterium]